MKKGAQSKPIDGNTDLQKEAMQLHGLVSLLNKKLTEFIGENSRIYPDNLDFLPLPVPDKPEIPDSESLHNQIWIGELGGKIINLSMELKKLKSKYASEVGNNNSLKEELASLLTKIKELQHSSHQLKKLKENINELYDQFFMLRDSDYKNGRLLAVKLRKKYKKLGYKYQFLLNVYNKLSLLLKLVTTLNPQKTIHENRLLRKYDWEVDFLRASGCFDYSFFLTKYEDIQTAKIDPIRHFVVKGFQEGRNPNIIFDTTWYLNRYDDVRNTGQNPFIHYLQKGIFERRQPNAQFDVAVLEPFLKDCTNGCHAFTAFLRSHDVNNLTKSKGHQRLSSIEYTNDNTLKQIVFISGLVNNTSHQFRVVDQIKILTQLGYTATYISIDDIVTHQHLLIFAEVVVVFRAAWDQRLHDVLTKCKEAGVVIVYDTDDFVFDSEIANEKYVDGIRFLKGKEIDLYHEGVLRYRKALEYSDFGVFTTPRLVNAYKSLLKKEAFAIRNGFSDYFLQISKKALEKPRKKRSTIIIGYASGSLTHQKDFRIAVGAIAKVLKENPNCKLRIIGLVNIDEFVEFKPLSGQIESLPVAPHDKLPYELADIDINLAPLEIDNPFCEAKSELKYFEAGLVKVPTVASATEPFAMAIENGVTGYLAKTDNDWYVYLSKLVKDEKHRQLLGANAHKHVLRNYSYDGKASDVQAAFEKIYDYRKTLLSSRKFSRTITFVLPEMSKGSGGHAKAISVAKGLTKYNHTVTLNLIGHHKDYCNPEDIEHEFGLDTKNIRVVYSDTPASDSNIVFATFWKTVYYIENSQKWFGTRYHFLQDYEPYFYAMGTDYLLAINAMKKNLTRISYGPWIKEILKIKHNIECSYIPFYYNKDIYFPDKQVQRKTKTILFFARPEMPRRCFDLGWKALEIFREKYGNEVEIIFFGSYVVDHIDIGIKHTNLGVKSPAELANLYRKSTLGIAFSPTNPSMVPFEMMACGLPVLDLDVEGNEINYGGRENVFLVDPDAHEIADRINEILNTPAKLDQVGQNGMQFIQQLPTEDEAIAELNNMLSLKTSLHEIGKL